jgi:hypothetical protein
MRMGAGMEGQGGSPGCAADGERRSSRWKCKWRRRAAAAERPEAMEVGLRGLPSTVLLSRSAATATRRRREGTEQEQGSSWLCAASAAAVTSRQISVVDMVGGQFHLLTLLYSLISINN